MRTIELDPLSFIGSPEEKRFLLLRSKKADKDQNFFKNFAVPKIVNRKNANEIPGVWGTLGYKSKKPIDWLGNLKCSNEGNDDFDKNSELYKEIEYLKYMYPGLNEKGGIKEKVIDLRNLSIDVPEVFELEDLPDLRLDVFLDDDEGALAFYQLKRDNAAEKDIEFIQPQQTEGHTTQRDRLTYHFKVVPKKVIEPFEELPHKFKLSNENSEDDFIVKILIFKRKFQDNSMPTNSSEIIDLLEQEIERESGNLFAKKHKLLIFNQKSKDFNRVKNGSIDSDKKTLFLIHGTFASTKGSFGEVYSWIDSLLKEGTYEQVIAFDHPTLFDDAVENSKALFEIFEKYKVSPFAKSVDVIGTSQGGLIAQYLANFPNGHMPIGKVALVASANGVDYLSLANNLSKGLKLMRKCFSRFGFGKAVLISALLQHSIKWVIDRKGLDMMRPGSEALKNIMFNTPVKSDTRYWPIIGNYCAPIFKGKILEKAIDLVLDKDNDWVVSTKNQFKIPSAYCAIPEYNPGKYRDYAVTGKKALHGRLIEHNDVQSELEKFFEDEFYLESAIDESDNMDFFDAHCHLFGRSVVSGRIVIMALADLIDYFKQDNPEELLAPISLREEDDHESSFSTVLKNILKYFIFNKDAHDMLHDLENDYHIAYSDVYRYIPLMFDLEMTFKNAYEGDDSGNALSIISSAFNEEHKKMMKKIEGLIKKADQGLEIFNGSKSENDISIKILKNIHIIVKQLSRLNDSLSKDTKQSFHKQLDELENLKISYGNDVFPFLATDPRRTNMGSYIEGRVGKGKTFHGVKLYTPNGYSPTDPHLFDTNRQFVHSTSLYKWCVDTKTPIMAHNSDAGFATFTDRLEVYGDICTGNQNDDGQFTLEYKNKEFIDFNYNLFQGGFGKAIKERAHTLNHPTLWRKVLTEYPTLKICLAHFGGGSFDWQNEIAQLIIDFDNVYTDLSCQTDITRLKEIKDTYFKEDTPTNMKIRSRVMYGSDYFLNLLQGAKFDQYYRNFNVVFSKNEMYFMSVDVPKKFLNLKKSL
jgi:predicted TIM-barrel fold metal-dependent hydrolase